MDPETKHDIGDIIKKRRVSLSLTLEELSSKSGVSHSHLGRIERGERYPSAHVLQKIAQPLNFEEEELFVLVGFLSVKSSGADNPVTNKSMIDPLVANMLACEPVDIQRAIVDILNLLKIIAKYRKSLG